MNTNQLSNFLAFSLNSKGLASFATYVYRLLPSGVLGVVTFSGKLHVFCDARFFRILVLLLKIWLRFNFIIDQTAVDAVDRARRFDVVVILRRLRVVSYSRAFQFAVTSGSEDIFIKLNFGEFELGESINDIFSCSTWLEREIWDFFGIFFSKHSDLRRILTDYGFQGHPFRKDFPLTGYTEVRYDGSTQRVVVEPVELAQEYRWFDFTTPWAKLV